MSEKTEADKLIELSSKESLFWKEHGDSELNKRIETFHILCVDLYHYAKGLEFALKCQGKPIDPEETLP